MSLDLSQSFGLERITREAYILLFRNLNDELARVEEHWEPLDVEFDAIRGKEYEPRYLERLEPENFHPGYVPTLVEEDTPIAAYPAVSVMAYRAQPSGPDELDQVSAYRDALYIEALVKASPVEGEEICNSRAWRVADAINNVVMSDRTLNGTVLEVQSSPTCSISDCFTKAPNAEAYGQDWFWQGARIEYGITKYSPFE